MSDPSAAWQSTRQCRENAWPREGCVQSEAGASVARENKQFVALGGKETGSVGS